MLPNFASAQTKPDPIALLRGVESARLQVPASSLKLRYTYRDALVTNVTDMVVDFDGELRGFNYDVHSGKGDDYRTVFDGSQALTYNGPVRQLEIRNPYDQNHMVLFDPRVLGLSTYYTWDDTIESTLPYKKAAKVELIGQEKIDGKLAWHVLITIEMPTGAWQVHCWIDDKNGFRVYRKDRNGVETYSYYENPNYPWLPSRVVGKERGRGSLDNETEWRVLDATPHVKLPSDRWSIVGMRLPPKTDVVDIRLKHRIGHWDGKQLVPEAPDVPLTKPKKHLGTWGYAVVVGLFLVAPAVVWILKRRVGNTDVA